MACANKWIGSRMQCLHRCWGAHVSICFAYREGTQSALVLCKERGRQWHHLQEGELRCIISKSPQRFMHPIVTSILLQVQQTVIMKFESRLESLWWRDQSELLRVLRVGFGLPMVQVLRKCSWIAPTENALGAIADGFYCWLTCMHCSLPILGQSTGQMYPMWQEGQNCRAIHHWAGGGFLNLHVWARIEVLHVSFLLGSQIYTQDDQAVGLAWRARKLMPTGPWYHVQFSIFVRPSSNDPPKLVVSFSQEAWALLLVAFNHGCAFPLQHESYIDTIMKAYELPDSNKVKPPIPLSFTNSIHQKSEVLGMQFLDNFLARCESKQFSNSIGVALLQCNSCKVVFTTFNVC